MASNTNLNPGSGGDTIRTLDRTGTGSPKTEAVALDLGGPTPNAEKFIQAGQQTMANSMPVAIAADQVDPYVVQHLMLESMRTQALLFASQNPGGFLPMEVPSFLGA
jgi:hypothetical protein